MDIIAIVNKKPAVLVVLIGTLELAGSCNSLIIKNIEKPFDKVVADNIESETLGGEYENSSRTNGDEK
jgi:hypothetical protein